MITMHLLLVDIYDRIKISFNLFLVSCLLFNAAFVRKFLSEIPERASEKFFDRSFLAETFQSESFRFYCTLKNKAALKRAEVTNSKAYNTIT